MRLFRVAMAAIAAASGLAHAQAVVSYSIDGPGTIDATTQLTAAYTITAHRSDGSSVPAQGPFPYPNSSNHGILTHVASQPGHFAVTGAGTVTLSYSEFFSGLSATRQVNVLAPQDPGVAAAFDCTAEPAGPAARYYRSRQLVGRVSDMIPLCNGQVLVASTAFNQLQAIDLTTGRLLRVWPLRAKPLAAMRLPGTRTFFASLDDGSLARLDAASGVITYATLPAVAYAVLPFEAGQVLAVPQQTGSWGAVHVDAMVVDVATLGVAVRSFPLSFFFSQASHPMARYDSAHRTLFYTQPGDGFLATYTYDPASGSFTPASFGARAESSDLAVSPDGTRVLHPALNGPNAGSSAMLFTDFRASDLGELGYFEMPAGVVDFRHDGAKVIAANATQLMVFDVATHKAEAAWPIPEDDCQYNAPSKVRWSALDRYAMTLETCGLYTEDLYQTIDWVQLPEPGTDMPPASGSGSYTIDGPAVVDASAQTTAPYSVTARDASGHATSAGLPLSPAAQILSPIANTMVVTGTGTVVLSYSNAGQRIERMVRVSSGAGPAQPLALDCSSESSDAPMSATRARMLLAETTAIVPLCHHQVVAASFGLNRLQAIDVGTGEVMRNWLLAASPVAMVRVPGTTTLVVSLDSGAIARVDMATGVIDYATLPRIPYILLAYEPGQVLAIAQYVTVATAAGSENTPETWGLDAYVIDAPTLQWRSVGWPTAPGVLRDGIAHYDAANHFLYFSADNGWTIQKLAFDAASSSFVTSASSASLAQSYDFTLSPDGTRVVAPAWSADSRMQLLDLAARDMTTVNGIFPTGADALAFQPDGARLLAASRPWVLAYDAQTRALVGGMYEDAPRCYGLIQRFGWSPASRYLVDLQGCDVGTGVPSLFASQIRVSDWPAALARIPSSITLQSGDFSPTTIHAGDMITLRAAVGRDASGQIPTGTVTFSDNGVPIPGCTALPLDTFFLAAQCTASLQEGMHDIKAAYSGDALFLPSMSDTKTWKSLNNYALASNGGVASASSQLNSDFPIAAINNGERAGAGWTHGGGWADGTVNQWPDWVQIDFDGPKLISQVVVYTVQDNYQNPIEPTDGMTFTQQGVTSFDVQGWDGEHWVTLASTTFNRLVKATVPFAPFNTTKIRINVTSALYYVSRITEVEAWGLPGTPMETNMALAANGGVATASSQLNSDFPIAAINDGERAGVNWGHGGGWADGTVSQWPDWVQVDFNGVKTIDKVVVYTMHDSYQYPSEPSDTMTFAQQGVTGFDVQGWNGSRWVTLASVANNNLLKRTVTFSAFNTTKIRINVTAALYYVSRIVEVEAWGTAAGPETETNVALAAGGAVASASSQLSSDFPIAAINNGERAGANWTHGGGWADGTMSQWPDWVQVDFNGAKLIDKVVVYTVQDNYQSPSEPTDTMTFTQQGVTGFDVQGWDGSQWVNLASVTNNNLVKRTVTFSAFKTTKIRINVTSALYYVSRITEVEAWGIPVPATQTNVALAANGAVASASSQLSSDFPIAAINDGERAGANWTHGGGWADATIGQWPDWVQIDFNGSKTIDKVVVYTLQDNYQNPVEPTDTMTFFQQGVTGFDVQGWDGAQWVTLASVTGSRLVKHTVTFNAFTTTKIRITVTSALYYVSRITEVEAWTQ